MKKILGLLLSSVMLTSESFSCDYRLLDSEAESYKHCIQLGSISSFNKIKESLTFVLNEDKIDKKYTNSQNFKEFVEFTKENPPNDIVTALFKKSDELYDELTSPAKKAALYMLLEEVTKKVNRDLEQEKKMQKIKEQFLNSIK